MPRTVEYIGEQVELSDYLPEHHFKNQAEWAAKSIPLNPNLRSDFDSTANEDREDLEVEHWWGKPYIVTQDYWLADNSYEEFFQRMKEFDKDYAVESEKEWNERIASNKDRWFKAWPSGVRYEVRCLNGGAWDRSSSIAMVATLEEAITVATGNIPDYRNFY